MACGRKVRGGSWAVYFQERPVRLYKSIYVANDEDAKRVDELLHNAMQVVPSLDMEQDWDKDDSDEIVDVDMAEIEQRVAGTVTSRVEEMVSMDKVAKFISGAMATARYIAGTDLKLDLKGGDEESIKETLRGL
jgi:hypothetical protein